MREYENGVLDFKGLGIIFIVNFLPDTKGEKKVYVK